MGSRESTTEDFVKLEQVTKVYQMGEVQIRAVDGIDLDRKSTRLNSSHLA